MPIEALLPPISPSAPTAVIDRAIQIGPPGQIMMTISGITASAAAIARLPDGS